ncbi:hypothetical protein LQZ19_01295 [Treponema primitia]
MRAVHNPAPRNDGPKPQKHAGGRGRHRRFGYIQDIFTAGVDRTGPEEFAILMRKIVIIFKGLHDLGSYKHGAISIDDNSSPNGYLGAKIIGVENPADVGAQSRVDMDSFLPDSAMVQIGIGYFQLKLIIARDKLYPGQILRGIQGFGIVPRYRRPAGPQGKGIGIVPIGKGDVPGKLTLIGTLMVYSYADVHRGNRTGLYFYTRLPPDPGNDGGGRVRRFYIGFHLDSPESRRQINLSARWAAGYRVVGRGTWRCFKFQFIAGKWRFGKNRPACHGKFQGNLQPSHPLRDRPALQNRRFRPG